MSEVSIEDLREHFLCDAEKGILTRKVAAPRAPSGAAVGHLSSKGYLQFMFQRKWLLVHRVIFAMHYGKWPSEHLDHINNVHTDNRICNLRECNRYQNMRNMTRRKKPKSGYRGVEWGSKNTWKAYIRDGVRQRCIGSFKTPVEAAHAYDAAARKLHGEFATTNFPQVTP